MISNRSRHCLLWHWCAICWCLRGGHDHRCEDGFLLFSLPTSSFDTVYEPHFRFMEVGSGPNLRCIAVDMVSCSGYLHLILIVSRRNLEENMHICHPKYKDLFNYAYVPFLLHLPSVIECFRRPYIIIILTSRSPRPYFCWSYRNYNWNIWWLCGLVKKYSFIFRRVVLSAPNLLMADTVI